MSFVMGIHDAKRKKRNEFVTLPGYSLRSLVPRIGEVEIFEPISIDKDDYLAVNEILSESLGCYKMLADGEDRRIWSDEKAQMIRRIIKVRPNDCHRRIWYLNLSEPLCGVTWMPTEIGKLKELEKLALSWSSITEIPSSIGQLKNLKELDLGMNVILMKLPEEIGDLVSLTRLDLHNTSIGSLPGSIGRLRNLKDLGLSLTIRLVELPQEIGELASLENLDLGASSIKSLPSSIAKLSKLKRLDLSKTKIVRLPKFIERLSCLRYLNVCGTDIPELKSEKNQEEYLLALLQRCPFLEEMDYADLNESMIFEITDHEQEQENEKITFALERNRARIVFRSVVSNLRPETVPKLWPHMLENAMHAFERIGTLDAVYHLLVVGVDSFGEILRERKNRDRDNSKRNRSTKCPASAT